jgi:hypothetical protein
MWKNKTIITRVLNIMNDKQQILSVILIAHTVLNQE